MSCGWTGKGIWHNCRVYNPLLICVTPMIVPAYSVNSFPSRWQAELSLRWTALVRHDLNSLVVWHGLHSFSPFFLFPTLKTSHYLSASSPTLNFSVSLPFALCVAPLSSPTFPVSASRILGMQIWICKCYRKHRSRCVIARTELGQHGHADMPCMQVKLVYNMAPRGLHTRAQKLNGWTPQLLVEGPPLSVIQGCSRQENYTSREGLYSFIFVRIPVSQTTCQAALYGNKQNLGDEWNWGQKCDLFSAAEYCACQPRLVEVSKVWGCHVIVGKTSSWLRHGCEIIKQNLFWLTESQLMDCLNWLFNWLK